MCTVCELLNYFLQVLDLGRGTCHGLMELVYKFRHVRSRDFTTRHEIRWKTYKKLLYEKCKGDR